jgi:glycosyltransferase involved in cell wall biosynthesis
MKCFKKYYRLFRNYYFFLRKSHGHNIKLFNYQWDNSYCVNNHWLHQFIYNLGVLPKNKTLHVISVNCNRSSISLSRSDFKIFYTVENVHVVQSPWIQYEDLLLNDDRINLSIGFDYIENPKYIRFPYWIMTNFSPSETYESINEKCSKFQELEFEDRNKFCAFICRYDYFGDRLVFADIISQIAPVHFPGLFRHNDDSLKEMYNENKIEYLKQFKFNLCPENSDNDGYVTEKIFDAIKSGCIPIYWGSGNKPEPDILNPDRILFLSLDSDNSEVLQKIDKLNRDKIAYHSFLNQPVFKQNAQEIIFNYFKKLEKKISNVLVK